MLWHRLMQDALGQGFVRRIAVGWEWLIVVGRM